MTSLHTVAGGLGYWDHCIDHGTEDNLSAASSKWRGNLIICRKYRPRRSVAWTSHGRRWVLELWICLQRYSVTFLWTVIAQACEWKHADAFYVTHSDVGLEMPCEQSLTCTVGLRLLTCISYWYRWLSLEAKGDVVTVVQAVTSCSKSRQWDAAADESTGYRD